MGRINAYVLAVVFMMAPVLSYAAGEAASIPVTGAPVIVQVVGEARATLGPARYPSFYHYSSDNPTCGEYLKAAYNDPQPDTNGVADTGLSNAPIWLKGTMGQGGAMGSNLGYQTVLSKVVEIPAQSRKSARVLVAWTVRVEASASTIRVWPALCHPWHGQSDQDFSGGVVRTHLFVNGQEKGQDATMTVPESAANTDINISDPTISGTYLLRASDFADGMFPATLTLEIKWMNETSMSLASPAKMRSMIVTMMPLNQE